MPDYLQEIVEVKGKPALIDSGTITKSMVSKQRSERIAPNLTEMVANNVLFSKLKRSKKQGVSVHRATAFLPQE
jgi:hypothetical protein